MAHAYFLAGDSYPDDLYVEEAVTGRLERAGVEVITQARINALAGPDGGRVNVNERVGMLRKVIAEADRPEPPFIIGRSSGARVATLVASQQAVAGLVCFGYPFRPPGQVIEPARFSHLAKLTTPTLILQGERDRFGGRGLTRDYALSASISLHFVDTNHMFRISEAAWDDIARRLARFIIDGDRGPATEAFDEAFYLSAFPKVAALIERGVVASAEQHFELFGRRKGRVHQLAPRRPAPSK